MIVLCRAGEYLAPHKPAHWINLPLSPIQCAGLCDNSQKKETPMITKTCIAIGLLLTASCSCVCKPSNHYSVVIDSRFTPEQTNLVLDSLHTWEDSLPGRLSFDIGVSDTCSRNDSDHLICIHADTLATVRMISDSSCIGYTIRNEDYGPGGNTNDSADVLIPTDDSYMANDKDAKTVISHEVGHALGLSHTYNWGDLMYPNLSHSPATAAPVCDDLNQFARLRNEYDLPQCKGEE